MNIVAPNGPNGKTHKAPKDTGTERQHTRPTKTFANRRLQCSGTVAVQMPSNRKPSSDTAATEHLRNTSRRTPQIVLYT